MTAAATVSDFGARVCVACGTPANTVFCTHCGADVFGLRLALVRPSADVVRLEHKLNVGAALLPGLWTFWHGAPVLGVLYWLFFFPLPPISIGIMVYLLFNGNRVALQRRRFATPAAFAQVQRAWTIAGVVLLPVLLFTLIVFIAAVESMARQGAFR